MTELEQQIEKAFDYRGNVTITFKNGNAIEGFLYNREFSNPKTREQNFIEVFLAPKGEPAKFKITDLESVILTGEDHAAGKSYEDWIAKQKKKDSDS
ncbi:MAG: hypothetical protein A3C46_02370 [Deltaproteobacteria bacterium RIFCSPHIGHO2_02_FULL_44_16]|nr:MAG: hypothetical protein A3C46_02370 [Deltaproteobacteria bacterium RIFCSPHIGHO2_02_FULL_44_16]